MFCHLRYSRRPPGSLPVSLRGKRVVITHTADAWAQCTVMVEGINPGCVRCLRICAKRQTFRSDRETVTSAARVQIALRVKKREIYEHFLKHHFVIPHFLATSTRGGGFPQVGVGPSPRRCFHSFHRSMHRVSIANVRHCHRLNRTRAFSLSSVAEEDKKKMSSCMCRQAWVISHTWG